MLIFFNGHFVYFMATWWSFGIFYRFVMLWHVFRAKKNLATMDATQNTCKENK
jgi:hypothetical protein